MRAWTGFVILGAVLMVPAITPAAARSMATNGAAVSRPLGSATPSRIVSHRTFGRRTLGRRVLVFDRSLGRFVAVGFRGFSGIRRSTARDVPFGFVDGLGVAGAGAVGPALPAVIFIAPQSQITAAQATAASTADDLPPCHEVTPVGVVIERGTSCSRAAR
jgi:hypothetical protein